MSDDPDHQSTASDMPVTFAGKSVIVSRFTILLVLGALVGAAAGLVTVVFRKFALTR